MALSDITQNVRDGALGVVPDAIDNVVVCFGISTTGTATTTYSLSDPKAAQDALTSGPLCEAVAHILEVLGKGPVYAVPVTSDVAGACETPVRQSGGGPLPTTTGTPNDDYEVHILIVVGGAVGTATFKYSLDGGDTWSEVITTAATYLLPGTGVTVVFTAGTYVAAELYEFDCTAPGYSTSNLGTAIDAFLTGEIEASLMLVVGVPATVAGSASLVTAVQTKLVSAAGAYRYMRAMTEVADDTDANIISAFASVDASRVCACAGFTELVSALSSLYYKRNAAWPAMARAAQNKVHRHLGAVKDGGLTGVNSLHRDERTTTALADQRFLVLRTRIGKPGFFVEQPWTMASKTSDFRNLHNGRVIDKACRVAYYAMLDYLNEDWFLNVNGRISESEAARIEADIKTRIENALLPDGNCSAVQFIVSRTDDILGTEKINVKTRVQPKGYSRFIENDIGFTKTITS